MEGCLLCLAAFREHSLKNRDEFGERIGSGETLEENIEWGGLLGRRWEVVRFGDKGSLDTSGEIVLGEKEVI